MQKKAKMKSGSTVGTSSLRKKDGPKKRAGAGACRIKPANKL